MTSLEYALIGTLVFLAIVGAVHNYTDRTKAMYDYLSNTIAPRLSSG